MVLMRGCLVALERDMRQVRDLLDLHNPPEVAILRLVITSGE